MLRAAVLGALVAACGGGDAGRELDPEAQQPRQPDPAPAATTDGLSAAAGNPAAAPPRTLRLDPGSWVPVEGSLAPAERHRFVLHGEPDAYVLLGVAQEGVDLEARVLQGEESLVVSDRPTDDQGEESLIFVVPAGGQLGLQLSAAPSPPGSELPTGSYGLRLHQARPATGADRRLASQAARFALTEELAWEGREDRAIEILGSLLEELGPEAGGGAAPEAAALRAEVLERLGRHHGASGRWQQAEAYHRRAAV
ncbi:MAG: hypothetical protein MI919_38830, partial [Holophagales bacterium]|nr:hypothetical protein [Holophagales bacterium]